MKILFVGGGTLGPVTPLLAVAEKWRERDSEAEIVWVGTPNGPERHAVSTVTDQYYSLPVARLPRYPSFEWPLLPIKLCLAFLKAFYLLLRERPNVIATAGGYTAVPMVIVGKLFGMPSWVHQQDVTPILTNRLLAPFARWVTISWEMSKVAFPFDKTDVIGNPVRDSVLHGDKKRALKDFGLNPDKRTVLIFGGGGGARYLNKAMEAIAPKLSQRVNVIHIAGKKKISKKLRAVKGDYFVRELLTTQMADALALADVVVCRAGMGTITELSALKKASIIIPLPKSPQLANVHVLNDSRAAKILYEDTTTPGEIQMEIMRLLEDDKARTELGERIHTMLPTDVAGKIVDLLNG
jgi:UDP-N-acetylglucosamine--N-acetylmuramyl-(pentapeptide) pyrophosphoryl-undecaprenol N-acetylglucosamine transferase